MTQICFQTPHCGWPRNLNVQLLHKADCGEERVCRQRQFCPYEEPLVLHLTHHTSRCALLRSGQLGRLDRVVLLYSWIDRGF